MNKIIVFILVLILILISLAVPSWLFMLGFGNFGLEIGFWGSVPFGALFYWLVGASLAAKNK